MSIIVFMNHRQYKVESKVWLYPGDAAWHFVTLPQDISEDIKNLFGDRAKRWGTIPVEITVGSSVWNTSIFPDNKEGAYVLPLKKDIRKKENIKIGDTLKILLEIIAN
jgi:hypothetical protein